MNYLLIWDIDGTLIQSRGVGKRAMNKAFLELYGIRNGFTNIDMAGKLDAVILNDAFDFHNISDRNRVRFFDTYCGYLKQEIESENRSFAIAGIRELLAVLKNKGNFCNVLGTGNIEKGARMKLDYDRLNEYFATGGFGEEPMERWQVIEKAICKACSLFKTDFEKKNIYVIGDTQKDIDCAIKLETKSIGIAKGPFSTRQLIQFGANHAFDDFSDTGAFLSIFE